MPRGRRQSPTRGGSELATTEERSASRTRGRAAGMKKLRGGAAGSDDEEEGGKDDEEAGWKEFRKGSFVARVSLFGASSNTLTSFVDLDRIRSLPLPHLVHHPRLHTSNDPRRLRIRRLSTEGCRSPSWSVDEQFERREGGADGGDSGRRRYGGNGERGGGETVGGAASVSGSF